MFTHHEKTFMKRKNEDMQQDIRSHGSWLKLYWYERIDMRGMLPSEGGLIPTQHQRQKIPQILQTTHKSLNNLLPGLYNIKCNI